MPEGHPRRRAWCRRDDHAVVLDGVHAPGGGAELKDVADARLVDELFVQLAEPSAIGKVDRVQASIGDRAPIHHRHQPRTAQRRQTVGGSVPDDPRIELGGDVGRILAGEHRQYFVERRARERVIRVGPANEREQRGTRPIVVDRYGCDDNLREHVERVLDNARRLDVAIAHAAGDGDCLERVVTKGRDKDAATHRVERVPGTADALERRGDALRALQLEHDVDRADVDSKLEGARAHEGAQLSRFERSLEQEAALARERAVIGERHLFAGEGVDPRRHTLRLRTIVHEDDRRPRAAHVPKHQRRDRGPDRPARNLTEVLHGRLDRDLGWLHQTAVDYSDGPECGKREAGRGKRRFGRRLRSSRFTL